MERGTLRLTIDGTAYTLRAGDAIYYAGDCWHGFANPGRETCAYYLAMELAQHAARPATTERRTKRGKTRRRT
jgi:quercetin dioxygenase-like cupin family protein